MYKSTFSGSAYDEKGVRYSFNAGQEIQAPKGSLDHVEGLKWVEEKQLGINDLPNSDDLIQAGFDSIEKVREASDEELEAINGIGKATVKKIRALV